MFMCLLRKDDFSRYFFSRAVCISFFCAIECLTGPHKRLKCTKRMTDLNEWNGQTNKRFNERINGRIKERIDKRMDGWMDGWTREPTDIWIDERTDERIDWRTDGWVDEQMNRWMDGRINERINGRTDGWTNERTDESEWKYSTCINFFLIQGFLEMKWLLKTCDLTSNPWYYRNDGFISNF